MTVKNDRPRRREIEILRTFHDGERAPLSEVVKIIRSLPAEGAERFLHAILTSPAIGRMHRGDVLCQANFPATWEGLLRTPDQSLKLIAEADGQTSNAERAEVARKLREDAEANKISGLHITAGYVDSLGKSAEGDAAQKAARRARQRLGVSKSPGRPKKPDINK